MIIPFLFLLIVFTAIGQIFLKLAALKQGYRVIYWMVGYTIFIFVVIVSFNLMKHMDLKVFTALNSIIYIVVLFSSALVFKEKITLSKFIGTIVVLIGVVVFNL